MSDPEVADATQDDSLVEETPTDYPDDAPADYAVDASYVPSPGFDEGIEVTT